MVVPRGADADAASMKSSAAPIASRQLEARGQGVGGHAGAHHADREAAALECVVAAREAVHLRIADLGPGGHVDLLALGVHREARERHPVLPADQPADPAHPGLDHEQAAAVTLAPDDALGVRGHELAVDAEDGALPPRRTAVSCRASRPTVSVSRSVMPITTHDAGGAGGAAERVGLRRSARRSAFSRKRR